MNSAAAHTKWHRFRNSLSRVARLCRIVFSRCFVRAVRLLREHRNRPAFNRFTGQPVPKPRFTLRLQYLWLTAKLWFLRFCRSFVNYPGWTIASVSGAIGIILLVAVQIEAFLPKSASEAEPLMEPFIKISDVNSTKKVDNRAEVKILHDDPANIHPSLTESSTQPVFEIDVVLFPLRGVQEYPEQYLVTSVRERHPLNHLPIRTGKSLWNVFGRNHNRIAIQPTDYQSPEFRNEQPSAESFVEPLQTKPVHNGIPFSSSEILSSVFSTQVTLAKTTFAETTNTETKTAGTTAEQTTIEQTTIAETPKLNLVVTIADRTQLGQPVRIQFQMVNTGRVSATNVILGIEITEEFTYQKGQSLEYKVGTIPPGESRLARLTPKATKPGVAVFEIELTADAGFSHILKKHVQVVAAD